MARLAPDGLGRIGKPVLPDRVDPDAVGDIVRLHDPVGDAEQHALRLEPDSVHDHWKTPVLQGDGDLIVNGSPNRPADILRITAGST